MTIPCTTSETMFLLNNKVRNPELTPFLSHSTTSANSRAERHYTPSKERKFINVTIAKTAHIVPRKYFLPAVVRKHRHQCDANDSLKRTIVIRYKRSNQPGKRFIRVIGRSLYGQVQPVMGNDREPYDDHHPSPPTPKKSVNRVAQNFDIRIEGDQSSQSVLSR